MVATRDFRYQGDAIVQETLNGAVDRTYVVDEAGAVVKMMIPAGSDVVTYLVTWNGHGDALALWRENSDGSLTLANSYTYDTWGTPTTATHNGVGDLGLRFMYVGRFDVQWDNAFGLDLHYMHARHYSPTLGRFLQPDPAALDTNLYAYADNGPTTKTDPTGRAIAVAACFTPWTIKICIDAGLVLVTGTGAVIAFVVHGDTRKATVATRTWTPPPAVRRDAWWRDVQIQLVKKTQLEREARGKGFDKVGGTRHGDLWVHPDGRRTIIPRHNEIPKGTAGSIRKVLNGGGRRGGR